MKNLNKLKVVLFLAISVIFASCNDDENSSDIPDTGSYISAKIDGVQFTVTNTNGAILGTKSGTGVNTEISILGEKTDSNNITISLSGISAPGTYAVNPETSSLLDFFDYNSEQSYDTSFCDSGSGTITVTSLTSTQIEGTFSFVGKYIGNCTGTGKNITEGRFRVIFVAL
jgi:Family of unknown function (DUF6252)